MASTFLGLNTAGSGLTYFQSSLNTTAHNISNSNTEGYSRQQVLAQASTAIRVHQSYGMQGTGITVTGVTQMRNAYYDAKYSAAIAKKQEYAVKNQYLLELETYMNEQSSETGYTKIFSDLSSTMQSLATNPSDSTTRTQFVQGLSNLSEYVNELASNYQAEQKSASDEISLYVDEINSISKRIFSLNEQIVNIEVRGGNANDLRDQRQLTVDKLSELVNVTVDEDSITYGSGKDAVESGASRYTVRINGHVLVDDMGFKELMVVPRDEKVNDTDIKGLYDVYWTGTNGSQGEEFDLNDSNLTGKLKGLYEIRDGNNSNALSGTIYGIIDDSVTTSIKLRLTKSADIMSLNIPDSGVININGKAYYYEGWTAEQDDEGGLSNFTFQNLKSYNEDGKLVKAEIKYPDDFGKNASVGDNVNFKGIPYYMQQLTEFARTFSKYMNDIHSSADGADSYGNQGLDIYSALDTNGNDYVLNGTFTAGTISNSQPSYYQINLLNWGVNSQIIDDAMKVVVSYASDVSQGNKEANDIIKKMIGGLTDRNMFKQGMPSQFMESITINMAVDTKMNGMFADNQEDIVNVINNQRMSVSSVDQNEEANALVVLQSGYNLSCKVIQVLDEVYDKLINGTAV